MVWAVVEWKFVTVMTGCMYKTETKDILLRDMERTKHYWKC